MSEPPTSAEMQNAWLQASNVSHAGATRRVKAQRGKGPRLTAPQGGPRGWRVSKEALPLSVPLSVQGSLWPRPGLRASSCGFTCVPQTHELQAWSPAWSYWQVGARLRRETSSRTRRLHKGTVGPTSSCSGPLAMRQVALGELTPRTCAFRELRARTVCTFGPRRLSVHLKEMNEKEKEVALVFPDSSATGI